MTQIIALHQPEEAHDCDKCRELKSRIERGLRLHAQTTNQLAQTEAMLVKAKREIRELKAQLAKGVPCN